MTQLEVLNKIHEDLELLKQEVAEMREIILIEPQLREEVILQVKEARKRITHGEFFHNEEVLKEFDLA